LETCVAEKREVQMPSRPQAVGAGMGNQAAPRRR
jgi:hypothetical protein